MSQATEITETTVSELTLNDLGHYVEIDGRAGQLVGWDADGVLLGPTTAVRKVPANQDWEISILDRATNKRERVGVI